MHKDKTTQWLYRRVAQAEEEERLAEDKWARGYAVGKQTAYNIVARYIQEGKEPWKDC